MQRRTLLKLSAAAAAGAGVPLLGFGQAHADPAPSTPFAVGVRQFNWSRGSRRIPTVVYYPAVGTPGGSPIPNAPIASGVFPVCGYQHGYTANPQGALPLLGPLAAAGFIVPAPNLPRANPGDASNGNLARDNSEVLTRTLALNTGSDPFAGHINTAVGVGMSGNSMGGMTTHAMLTAYPDPRIKAAMLSSCVDMGNPSPSVRANVLFVHGDRDSTTPYSSGRRAYAEMPPPKAFLTFIGGTHGSHTRDSRFVRTTVDWMRWSLYGDTAARDRLPGDAMSPSTRWEFVPGGSDPGTGYQNLVAQHSGKVCDIDARSTAAGARLQQYRFNGGTNQQFELLNTGDGHVRIRARHSGLFLQISSNSSGAEIAQQTASTAASQQWRIVDHGGGVISLINRQSGLAMDVWERSTADGARISQYTYTGNANQRFTRRAV